MPRGDKSAYSPKQKREAEHIEESYRERGASEETAERAAWATVNKQDGGAKGGGKQPEKAERPIAHPKRQAAKGHGMAKAK